MTRGAHPTAPAATAGEDIDPGVRDGDGPQVSEDRMTATLPVRLSPGSVYAIGLNDSFYPGYKDLYGRPVIPLGICFKTAW
ncbi:MAG: hypothetical protein U9R79_16070 [Armatimonadota bacterium]|nr:hypothetical protein [Armatimonadota bacterium]